jgi:hypothetical protein
MFSSAGTTSCGAFATGLELLNHHQLPCTLQENI